MNYATITFFLGVLLDIFLFAISMYFLMKLSNVYNVQTNSEIRLISTTCDINNIVDYERETINL